MVPFFINRQLLKLPWALLTGAKIFCHFFVSCICYFYTIFFLLKRNKSEIIQRVNLPMPSFDSSFFSLPYPMMFHFKSSVYLLVCNMTSFPHLLLLSLSTKFHCLRSALQPAFQATRTNFYCTCLYKYRRTSKKFSLLKIRDTSSL